MRNVHYKVMKSLGLVALAVSAFSVNTAYGAFAQDGMSLDQLKSVVPDMEISLDGNTLSFAGSIPSRCLGSDATNDKASISYKGVKDGQHIVIVHMPKCEKDFKAVDGEDTVALSSAFPDIHLQDKSGKVELHHLNPVDPKSSKYVSDEDLGVSVVSSADKAAAQKQAELQDLQKNITDLCKHGDFDGLDAALDSATDILGDVSKYLDQSAKAHKAKLLADLKGAKNANDAKSIHDKLVEAANNYGWDQQEFDDAYVEKRFDLISKMTSDLADDPDAKAADVERAINAWNREMRAGDSDIYRANKAKFGSAYSDLAVQEANSKDYVASAQYFEEAKKFTAKSDIKLSLDKNIGLEYAEAFKSCVKKDSANVAGLQKIKECDKYEAASKEAAQNIKDALADAANQSDEKAQESADYSSAYYATYGGSGSGDYEYHGVFGDFNAAPGSLDTMKSQAIQSGMQNAMSQMYSGGNQMGAAAAVQPLY